MPVDQWQVAPYWSNNASTPFSLENTRYAFQSPLDAFKQNQRNQQQPQQPFMPVNTMQAPQAARFTSGGFGGMMLMPQVAPTVGNITAQTIGAPSNVSGGFSAMPQVPITAGPIWNPQQMAGARNSTIAQNIAAGTGAANNVLAGRAAAGFASTSPLAAALGATMNAMGRAQGYEQAGTNQINMAGANAKNLLQGQQLQSQEAERLDTAHGAAARLNLEGQEANQRTALETAMNNVRNNLEAQQGNQNVALQLGLQGLQAPQVAQQNAFNRQMSNVYTGGFKGTQRNLFNNIWGKTLTG